MKRTSKLSAGTPTTQARHCDRCQPNCLRCFHAGSGQGSTSSNRATTSAANSSGIGEPAMLAPRGTGSAGYRCQLRCAVGFELFRGCLTGPTVVRVARRLVPAVLNPEQGLDARDETHTDVGG